MTVKRTFKLTPRAAQDLKCIEQYTVRTWGTKQRDVYIGALDKRFSFLAKNPEIGNKRFDIGDGFYSYKQGSHLIFYTIYKNEIHIIGISHQSMDTTNYLF